MADRHYFIHEDAPALVRDIIDYCKKWGLWRDNCICAGGKCYCHPLPEPGSDRSGGLLAGYDDVWEEDIPDSKRERLFSVPIYISGTGRYEFRCFCSQERLLDMAFEGPLYDLLYLHKYRAALTDLSSEARAEICRLLLEKDSAIRCEIDWIHWDIKEEAMSDARDFMERREGWDPAEFDSYEEYLELVGFEDPFYGADNSPARRQEFASRDEMTETLERSMLLREDTLYQVFLQKKLDDYADDLIITDYGELEERIYRGFTDIFDRYGLRYDFCSSTMLTAYRLGEE